MYKDNKKKLVKSIYDVFKKKNLTIEQIKICKKYKKNWELLANTRTNDLWTKVVENYHGTNSVFLSDKCKQFRETSRLWKAYLNNYQSRAYQSEVCKMYLQVEI